MHVCSIRWSEPRRGAVRRRCSGRALCALAAAGVLATAGCSSPAASAPSSADTSAATLVVARRTFVRALRLHGTLESTTSFTASAPRLAGQGMSTLVVTRLVANGARVKPGDLLVGFDRQDQVKAARDRRAEWLDLEEQIKKKRAEHLAARAADETALGRAKNDVARATFDLLKKDLLPAIEVEKTQQAFEEAQATYDQLARTFDLKAQARGAELRILEIQRDRARAAMAHAEENAKRLSITAPIGGLAVIKSIWKGSTMAEVQEGEEVRAGVPIVQVIDPTRMRVRARVNQADIQAVAVGQAATAHFDAYPDLALHGRLEHVDPIGGTSGFDSQVRTFVVLISLEGADARLTPDLSVAVDIELLRRPDALVVPLDAVTRDGSRTFVRVSRDGRTETREVTLGPVSDFEAVVESGLEPGATVLRQPGPAGEGTL